MSVIQFIAEKFILFIGIAGLCLVLLVSVHIPKRMQIWTLVSVALLLVSAIVYRLELWTQTFETLSVWRVVFSAINYSIQPAILLSMMQVAAPMKKKERWILLPWLISIPIYATTQLTHFVCYFEPDNKWVGGTFRLYPYFIFAFYILAFVADSLLYFRRAHTTERLGIPLVAFGGALGVVLYLITDYSSDYTDIFMMCILLYYLFLYIFMSKSDPLTGLWNRQCLYRDMTVQAQRIRAVVSCDMNELKWINDTQGHSAGDKALQTIADCLSDPGRAKKSVYRVGGDEFTLFYFTDDEETVQSDIERMRELLAKTPYVCAFGYTMVGAGMSIETAINEADRMMYEDKSELKRKVLEAGGQLHRRSGDR